MRIHKASLVWQGVKAGIQLLPGGFIASVMVFYVILYLAGFEATEGETDTFLFALVTGGLFSLMFWRGCVNLALLLKLRRYNKAVELLAPKSLEELSRDPLAFDLRGSLRYRSGFHGAYRPCGAPSGACPGGDGRGSTGDRSRFLPSSRGKGHRYLSLLPRGEHHHQGHPSSLRLLQKDHSRIKQNAASHKSGVF